MNVIECAELGKRYRRSWALRNCTLSIPAGHIVALVGPNGAGKTTLLNLAVGLATATTGAVTVLDGMPAGRRTPWTGSPSWPRTRRCTRTCRLPTCCTSPAT